MRMRWIVALIVLGAAAAAPSQHLAADEAGTVEITVADRTPIEEVLALARDTLGVQLLWDPGSKNIRHRTLGQVRLSGSRAEVLERLRGVLTFFELIILPVGPPEDQVFLVVDARVSSPILKLKPEYVEITDENVADFETADGRFVTAAIRVEHISHMLHARNALTRLVTGGNIGNVTEVPQARTFVVSDFAPNVAAVYQMIRRIDLPGLRVTEAIGLRHARAEALAATLDDHFADDEARQPARPRAPPAVVFPTAPRITPDPRTNRILVTATPSEMARVRETVALLDVPLQTSGESTVLLLKRAGCDEVAEACRALGEAEVSVVTVPSNNAMLLVGPAEAVGRMKAVVQSLDALFRSEDREK